MYKSFCLKRFLFIKVVREQGSSGVCSHLWPYWSLKAHFTPGITIHGMIFMSENVFFLIAKALLSDLNMLICHVEPADLSTSMAWPNPRQATCSTSYFCRANITALSLYQTWLRKQEEMGQGDHSTCCADSIQTFRAHSCCVDCLHSWLRSDHNAYKWLVQIHVLIETHSACIHTCDWRRRHRDLILFRQAWAWQ